MNLFFSVDNVAKLDKMLVKSEKKDIHLLFTPIRDNWGRYATAYTGDVLPYLECVLGFVLWAIDAIFFAIA